MESEKTPGRVKRKRYSGSLSGGWRELATFCLISLYDISIFFPMEMNYVLIRKK